MSIFTSLSLTSLIILILLYFIYEISGSNLLLGFLKVSNDVLDKFGIKLSKKLFSRDEVKKVFRVIKELKWNATVFSIPILTVFIIMIVSILGKTFFFINFFDAKIRISELFIFVFFIAIVNILVYRYFIFYLLKEIYVGNSKEVDIGYDERDAITNFLIGFFFVFICVTFCTFLFTNTKNEFNRLFYKNKSNLVNKVDLLITKFQPLKSKSIFVSDFTDLNLSSSIYTKILFLDHRNHHTFNSCYLNKYYSIEDTSDFNTLFRQINWDAILTGEYIEQQNGTIILNNNLIITNSNYQRVLSSFSALLKLTNPTINDSAKLKNSYIRTCFCFSGPLNYFRKLREYFVQNEDFEKSFFYKTYFDIDYDIEILFPSTLSFTSNLDFTPSIVYYYLNLVHYWENFDNVFSNELSRCEVETKNQLFKSFLKHDLTNSKSKSSNLVDILNLKDTLYTISNKLNTGLNILNSLSSKLDSIDLFINKLSELNSFQLKDTSKVYKNHLFGIHLLTLKAFFVNERLIISHFKNRLMLQLEIINGNKPEIDVVDYYPSFDLLLKKMDFLFSASERYLELVGIYSKEQLQIIRVIYYYSFRNSVVRTITHDNNICYKNKVILLNEFKKEFEPYITLIKDINSNLSIDLEMKSIINGFVNNIDFNIYSLKYENYCKEIVPFK